MKVLLTGHKGYIGTHLVDVLKKNGYEVTGIDLNIYSGCNWEALISPDREIIKDFRDLTLEEIAGHDAIMHLAAISNDPMGDINPQLTYDINLWGSVNLARKAKETGVPKFLFSGSCSVYGKGEKLNLDENSKLNPVSTYAISKVKAEQMIGELADEHFCPVFLRNSTAYGHSAMLRVDLVVNNLLACAHATGKIEIKSDGTPWRPLIHAKDIANAFLVFLKAPEDIIHNKAINIGANKENYQVREIASMVKELVPEAEIFFTNEIGEDPRNYRVKFDLLNTLIPDFHLEYTLFTGMQELREKFLEHDFNEHDFRGDQFVRLRILKKKIKSLTDK